MSTTPSQNSLPLSFSVAGDVIAGGAFQHQLTRAREDLTSWNGESQSQLESVSEPALSEALTIAREMFGFEPTLRLMVDPEAPDFPYYSIEVRRPTALTSQDAVSRQLAWHARVQHLFSGPFNYPRLTFFAD